MQNSCGARQPVSQPADSSCHQIPSPIPASHNLDLPKVCASSEPGLSLDFVNSKQSVLLGTSHLEWSVGTKVTARMRVRGAIARML